MKTRLFILLIILGISSKINAQTKPDVLFLQEGTKEVVVKEVGQTEIKYTFPNEETIYSMNKYLVKKIVFGSGREEIIEIPFKEVKGLNDVDKVFITYNPEEVKGLINLGELYSKATGVTVFSNMSSVKNRSLEKMKAEATMIGANAVLISNAQSRGNYYGNEYSPSQSTQTVFFGQAYTTSKKSLDKWKETLEGAEVVFYQSHSLNSNDFSPKIEMALRYDENRIPIIHQISELNIIDGRLFAKIPELRTKNEILEIIGYENGTLTMMEKHRNTIYNYIFKTEESEFMKSVQTILGKN
jgi:hypothetical protein